MDQTRHIAKGRPAKMGAVSRRDLLRGRPRGAGRPIAAVGAACFSRQGVVCRLCGDHCEPGAISFRPALGGRAELLLDAASCTGCGDCVGVCPAAAIGIVETAP